MECFSFDDENEKIGEIEKEFFENGFFSEYLPPCFSIEADFDFERFALPKKNPFIAPVAFNMSRFSEKGKRRTIFIPEFTSYLRVNKLMKEEGLLADLIHCSQSTHSFSPLLQPSGTITRHEQKYSSLGDPEDGADPDDEHSNYVSTVLKKICRAKGARGILSLDIANFYGSIYTHFIPCIKLGYDEANSQFQRYSTNKSDSGISNEYKCYNELDRAVRGMNCNRTNGLLPGCLVSQFIAEAFLAHIDAEIENRGIDFVRYVDDYEVFIYNDAKIEITENTISEVLAKYALSLNNEKTKYTPFPYYVVKNLDKLFHEKEGSYAPEEIMELFNSFFDQESNGTKGAIRFLIKSLDPQITRDNSDLLFSYIWDIIVNDARSLIKACEVLIKKKDKLRIDESYCSLVDEMLINHIANNNHLEVVWLLYLRKQLFKTTISERVLSGIANSSNTLAKIVLSEEYWGFCSDEIKNCIINNVEDWLLGYQLFYNDYIKKKSFESILGSSTLVGYYSQIKKQGFTFYKKIS